MEKLRLELPLLLPDMPDDDGCVDLLNEYLRNTPGILETHVVRQNGSATLCLHFDPNLLPLGRVERLAHEAGAQITRRYRHENIAFGGLTTADSASGLADRLGDLPGMLHAQVNYAAGLAFVAYDSTQLDRVQIEEVMRRWGARPASPAAATSKKAQEAGAAHTDHGHDHGSAPAFLPHWMQERWTLLLVAAAGLFLAVGFFGERFFGLPAQIAFVFYLLAYVAGGYDVATHALPGLLRRQFDTDVLMLAAATGAAILGEWVEGAFLLFLFALGHAGEHYALGRARNAVNALGALMPKTARIKVGDQIEEISVEAVQIGQIVVVRPGDRVPVDGEISAGESSIDQAPVTGESVPVEKGPGDQVFAGTINQDAALDVRVTKLAKDNTLSRVMQMVQEAQSQQSPTQQFTQRFTRWFVPTVLIFTVLVAVVPPLLGWDGWASSFYRAMLLLVAASPCALALGTPAAVLAGIAQAARNGVLIKGGVHLENLGSLRVVAFDKTGTITQGKFEVVDVIPLNGASETDLLQVAAAVEQQSNHPLALAVVRAGQSRGLAWPGADGLENVPGRGVRSVIAGEAVWIGSLRLFGEADSLRPDSAVVEVVNGLEAQGRSTMIVSRNGRFLGVLGLADVTRPNAAATMRRLQKLGMEHLVMLTGDNKPVAERIAAEVGLTDVRADLLPEHKLEAVKALMAQYGSMAMVGDGVNDAPALATATVGLAMGGAGTAVALETADVALMADDLGKLPFAVGLSRASRAIIRQNLAISLSVIGLLIVSSVIGAVDLSGAVVLHEGSTIVVVMNALRLLRYQAPR